MAISNFNKALELDPTIRIDAFVRECESLVD
jgi:hypothetical protein